MQADNAFDTVGSTARVAENLTVAVTCYNHQRFIGDTLRSVFDQSLLPREIVVIDDASTDRSLQIIDDAAGAAPVPVRIIRRAVNSGGPGRPSNEAIDAARTELIAMVEGDDACVPGRLEVQWSALQQVSNSPLCFGVTETIGPDGAVSEQYRIEAHEILALEHREVSADVYAISGPALYRHVFEKRNVVASFSNMMFRRQAWVDVGRLRPDLKVCLDLDFVGRCCALGEITFVARKTCVHRLHGANTGGASAIRNRRELTTVRASHAARPTVAGVLDQLEAQLSDLLTAEAYWEARDGMLAQSLRTYLDAMRHGAPKVRTLGAAVKSVPHAIAAWNGWRRTP
jgi:GT2 family glycosyltransferase